MDFVGPGERYDHDGADDRANDHMMDNRTKYSWLWLT